MKQFGRVLYELIMNCDILYIGTGYLHVHVSYVLYKKAGSCLKIM